MTPRYAIGIDLGTTNSALAFAPVAGEGAGETRVFPIPQWETATSLSEGAVLPSFLYLREDGERTGAGEGGPGEWVAGRLARKMAADRPGRCVHSAKSWLCHPGADPRAPFLPWGSNEIPTGRKISPIQASALILGALRAAWDHHFAADGGERFEAQSVTVAVPASFDEAAQRLTLAAAEEAGFPPTVRLLEEPQAAFYAWLERHDAAAGLWRRLGGDAPTPRHVLVVDIGGGTSDFSLFEVAPAAVGGMPAIRRVAVSDHILLGGDNIDLAIAHHLEPRLAGDGGRLGGGQWDFLVGRCRDLKERVLADDGSSDERFTVAVPGQGASLVAGTLSAEISRREIEEIVLDGFFPACDAADRPRRRLTALTEWGLPFAADGAVSRHLAAFLAGRPRADAVLFNGGTLAPARLRRRIAEQIAAWQGGPPPLVLDHAEPELAVARGAARFGALVHRQSDRIEAGAGHAVFLALHRKPSSAGADGVPPPLVCILPHGARPEETLAIAEPALELRVNRPVRFQTYTSTRHEQVPAGAVVPWDDHEFRPLMPLETMARLDGSDRDAGRQTVSVTLSVRLSELGLLEVSCHSTEPGLRRSWPLSFDLRPRQQSDPAGPVADSATDRVPEAAPNVPRGALEKASQRLRTLLTQPPGRGGKLTAARVFKELEGILGLPRADWNWVLVRSLWPALEACMPQRALSAEHEETWLILAGFLLRPGFGAALDEVRIDGLWRLFEQGLGVPGKRSRFQAYILWRRVAGGLAQDRQQRLLATEIGTIRHRTEAAPAELVRLLGALERLNQDSKAELIARFTDAGALLAKERRHPAPFLSALGLLLNRAPLYAGPEAVVPPELVTRVFDRFAPFDWSDPELAELTTLFLRAARVVDNRSLDVAAATRTRIAAKLKSAGVAPVRVAKVTGYMPSERGERASLYGEALPPGLLLADD